MGNSEASKETNFCIEKSWILSKKNIQCTVVELIRFSRLSNEYGLGYAIKIKAHIYL